MAESESPEMVAIDLTRLPPSGYRPVNNLRPVLACLRCAALTEDTEAHDAWHDGLLEQLMDMLRRTR